MGSSVTKDARVHSTLQSREGKSRDDSQRPMRMRNVAVTNDTRKTCKEDRLHKRRDIQSYVRTTCQQATRTDKVCNSNTGRPRQKISRYDLEMEDSFSLAHGSRPSRVQHVDSRERIPDTSPRGATFEEQENLLLADYIERVTWHNSRCSRARTGRE